MTHNVAVLMVTFARRSLFCDAINSFIRHAAPRAMVVVDNNPAELLERSALKELYGEPETAASISLNNQVYEYAVWRIGAIALYHVPSGSNLGGAGGFQLGLEFASVLNLADNYYFVDDDVRIEADPFPPLLEILTEMHAPFASSLIYNEHMADFELNQHKLRFDRLTLAEEPVHPEQLLTTSIPIEANGFVGVLCRAGACTQLGGVYAPYFVLYDDVDLTYRLTRTFGTGRLVPASRIIHRFQAGPDYPSWKVALQLRNRVIFARRCFPFRTRLRIGLQALRSAVKLRHQSSIFKIRLGLHVVSSFVGYDRRFRIETFRIR